MMIQAGLYASGSDPIVDAAIKVWPALDAFLAEDAQNGVEDSFKNLATCMAAARKEAATNPSRRIILLVAAA